jgi:hypothetical protein
VAQQCEKQLRKWSAENDEAKAAERAAKRQQTQAEEETRTGSRAAQALQKSNKHCTAFHATSVLTSTTTKTSQPTAQSNNQKRGRKTKPKANITPSKHGLMNSTVLAPNFSFSFRSEESIQRVSKRLGALPFCFRDSPVHRARTFNVCCHKQTLTDAGCLSLSHTARRSNIRCEHFRHVCLACLPWTFVCHHVKLLVPTHSFPLRKACITKRKRKLRECDGHDNLFSRLRHTPKIRTRLTLTRQNAFSRHPTDVVFTALDII